MRFRETIQSDLDYLAEHTISRGITKYQPECIDFCYTLEHEGQPLGIGGFRFINKTTAWAWLDMSDLAKGNMIIGYRVIKEYMETFVKEYGVKRLQSYVECSFPKGVRMAQHLGFHEESRMKNFIGDDDAFLFVRFT